MPLLDNYNVVEYSGNNSGRTFSFPFRCYSLENLVVEYVNEDGDIRELLQNTEYSVIGGLDNNGGSITFPIPLEVPPITPNESIRISRRTPFDQPTNFPSYQQSIENCLDREAMQLQEIKAIIMSAGDMFSLVENAVSMASRAEGSADSSQIVSNNAITKVDQVLEVVAESQEKIELIVGFINSVTSSLEIETGISEFYSIAGSLENKVVELTEKVVELTEALENKVDKDPVIELVTTAGELITDLNDTLIEIPFRKDLNYA